MQMQEISSVLGAMPARFHLGVGGDDTPTLGEVLGDRRRLLEWLADDARLVGAPDDQVAASMLVQHTAMVLGGSMLAAVLLCGALPVAGVDAVRVAPGAGSPGSTRWRFSVDEVVVESGPSERLMARWVEVWIDGVLAELVDAVHSAVRVGRRMLVDDVMSAAAANLVFLDWWDPDAGFGRLAPLLAGLGTPRVGETVTFSTISHGDRDGLRSARRSCCLHFRCDPAHWCPTCPKLDESERERIMRTHLGHLDAVLAQRN